MCIFTSHEMWNEVDISIISCCLSSPLFEAQIQTKTTNSARPGEIVESSRRKIFLPFFHLYFQVSECFSFPTFSISFFPTFPRYLSQFSFELSQQLSNCEKVDLQYFASGSLPGRVAFLILSQGFRVLLPLREGCEIQRGFHVCASPRRALRPPVMPRSFFLSNQLGLVEKCWRRNVYSPQVWSSHTV